MVREAKGRELIPILFSHIAETTRIRTIAKSAV